MQQQLLQPISQNSQIIGTGQSLLIQPSPTQKRIGVSKPNLMFMEKSIKLPTEYQPNDSTQLLSPFQMMDKGITLNMEEEQRMFQRFLKTFSNRNWNDFANKILENDKNLVVSINNIIIIQREMKSQVQSTKSMTKTLSRNSLLSQGGGGGGGTQQKQSKHPQTQQQSNLNHYLTQFNTFKSHQWSKLNLELNQSRAQTTIQKMVDATTAKQEMKEWQDKMKEQETMMEYYKQSQQQIKDNNMDYTPMNEYSVQSQTDQMRSMSQQNNSQFRKRKFSDSLQEQINRDSVVTADQNQHAIEHQLKYKKYLKNTEINQLTNSLNQLSMLQSMKSVKILKKFEYPSTIEAIVKYIKEKDLDLYEQIRQTKNLISLRFDNYQDDQQNQTIDQRRSKTNSPEKKVIKGEGKEQKFKRKFTMNEREQLNVLKKCHVKPEDPKYLSTEVSERGELVQKVLALFFDMFRSYDMSFDKIIEQELNLYKDGIKKQAAIKDANLKQKEKELDKAIKRAQEIEYILQDNNNHVQALIAQRKAQEIRFKVTRNLIDNLIFSYKQKIQKIYARNRDQRLMARDFIFELKELKRFSEKDDRDFDSDFDKEEEDKVFQNLKKKVNKCTQTIQLFRVRSQKDIDENKQASQEGQSEDNPQEELQKQQVKGKRKRKPRKKRVKKLITLGTQILEEGEAEQIVDIGLDINVDLEGDEDDENQSDNSEGEQEQNSEDEQNQEAEEEIKEPVKQEINLSNIDSEGNDIDEKSEQELNETEQMQMQKENQYFRILEEFEPQQILDIIAFYNYQTGKDLLDKELQTDFETNSESLINQINTDSKNLTVNTKGKKFHTLKTPIVGKNRQGLGKGMTVDTNIIDDQMSKNDLSMESENNMNIGFAQMSHGTNQQSSNSGESPKRGIQHSMTGISLDEAFEDIQNLDLNDLDTMLASDKNYKKKSMQFLSGLIGQLKKTKTFKNMVEKTAKDLKREEDKKDLIKQEKWMNRRNGQIIPGGSPSNRSSNLSPLYKDKNQSFGNSLAVQNHPQSTKVSPMNSKNQRLMANQNNNSNNNQGNNNGNVIIEEGSSQSSDSDRGISKNKKNAQRSNQKQKPTTNQSTTNSRFNVNKKKIVPTKPQQQQTISNDKGIQVGTYVVSEAQQPNQHMKNYSIDSMQDPQQIPPPFVNIQINPYDDPNSPANKPTTVVGKLGFILRQKIETQLMIQNPQLYQQRLQSQMTMSTQQNGTIPMPFNLGQSRARKPLATHPMSKFLPTFIEKFSCNDKKFLNVNQISIKQLLKFIQSFYQDKYNTARESLIVKHQAMSDFVYDQLYNKYGIANITEKKLKEIFLTIKFNQQKNYTVEFFGKFLGLDSQYFSNDDLSFFYRMNRLMVFGYFQKKVMLKTFPKIQEELQIKVKQFAKLPAPGTNGPVLVTSEKYFGVLIEVYRNIKQKIFENIKERNNGIITEDDVYPACFQERLLDFDEFNRLLIALNGKKQDAAGFIEVIPILFERGRLYNQQNLKEEEKRIQLENVISIVFKHDLVLI
ncbi:UNKNOWN [Stylonychia lemnae]|uniref:Uncharacterized protein n=1 Tax=Stylonychia lemnae TaxID=5949 RepID=A0A078ATF4_STYLE|nr:UNKNOWN [Stylonychia lemnae]|eukprot:CDW85504.1 UNKNOWN [Stylonychia lemnae]